METERNVLAKAGDVVYIIVIMGLSLPFVLFGALYVWLSGMLFLLPLISVLYVSLGVVLVIHMFNRQKHEKVIYRIIIGAVLLSIVPAIPGIYDKTRPVLQDGSVETHAYAPFSVNTKAISLNKRDMCRLIEVRPDVEGLI